MEQVAEVSHRGRRQLLMLIGLFLLPPLAAWLAWQYLSTHGVSATTNNGTLVTPPRPVDLARLDYPAGQDADALRGRWVFVVFAGAECDSRCRRQLFLTRQVRIGVNKDMPRVRRLLVVRGGDAAALAAGLAGEHPDLTVAAAAPADARLAPFRGEGFDDRGGQFFLVDPLGNLMMYYALDGDDAARQGKGLLRDLQKLLKVSQIG